MADDEPFHSNASGCKAADVAEGLAPDAGAAADATEEGSIGADDPLGGEQTGKDRAAQVEPVDGDPKGASVGGATDVQALEVMVVGDREPSDHRLGKAEIKQLPGAFGDPFRAIDILPGVTPVLSGIPYFFIRGAPPGNTGYYFDDIPVPTLFHFAGGPGVLHPALVERVDLYAGAYPARYGRFSGGLVVGSMAEPEHRLQGEASLRLTDVGAMIEAPFAGGRGNVLAAGRYSYTALVLSLVVPDVTVNYWDYQVRGNYRLDQDDTLEVLWFGSHDFATDVVTQQVVDDSGRATREEVERQLANLTFHRVDLRWQRQLARGKFQQALMFGYDYSGLDGEGLFQTFLAGSRSDWLRQLSPQARLRTGVHVLLESQRVSTSAGGSSSNDGTSSEDVGLGFDPQRLDATSSLFGELSYDAAPGVELLLGLRSDLFVAGDQAALSLDPRVSARFAISERLTLTQGLGLASQAPSFVVPIPGVRPNLRGGLQRTVQHSAGLEYQLPADFRATATYFYNLFFNMTDIFGVVPLSALAEDAEVIDLLRVDGRAYGLELSLRRPLTERFGGFLSYTLSRSERYAGRLAGAAGSDRTHVFNVAGSYDLGRSWLLGGRFAVYTGFPALVPAASAPRRSPPFWRIDWRLQKRWYGKDSKSYWGLVLEVLNTTLNKETLIRDCLQGPCDEEPIGPITIPSVGVEGRF